MSIRTQTPVTLKITISSTIPAKISSTALKVRSFLVEAPSANTGTVYVADSSGHCAAGNAHELPSKQSIGFSGDELRGQDMYLDLSQFWLGGTHTGDFAVVTYLADGSQ